MNSKSVKVDLEISLCGIEAVNRRKYGACIHELTASLIWPRVGIAERSCSRSLLLEHGEWDRMDEPWHRRILFKETCTGIFGLCVSLSVSRGRAMLKGGSRRLAGYVFKTAGDYADNLLGVPGEVAEQHLKDISRRLLNEKEPGVMAQGGIDLDAADFKDGAEKMVVIELYSDSPKPKHLGKACLEIRSLK